ncbi:trypsin-3-like [Condylostylus longicornis]|uniref:trypsin-3-like n=1 Tax=Condylostylus longicornis TaxID=2530218 RepID=UPI00244E367C|nr:trypsin-3-like [Condylostylus longicornis]
MNNIWFKILILIKLISSICFAITNNIEKNEINNKTLRMLTSSPKLSSISSDTNIKLHRPLLDGQIIGGYPINIKSASYLVSLHFINHKCTGILIDKNWILTSGHCTTHLQPYNYYIYMGSNNIEKHNGLVVKVAELYRHPNYTKNLDYDFTLLKLVNYSSIGYNINIAKLPEQNEEIPDGIKFKLIGWNKNDNKSLFKENNENMSLKAIDVIKINSTKCHELYKNRGGITDRMFCAAKYNYHNNNDNDDNGICHAEPGSPIIINNKAIGVASWGYGCKLSDYPNVYAKISYVRDWIKYTSGV